jgi:hypothetical protein
MMFAVDRRSDPPEWRITVILLRDEHRDVRKGDRIIPVEDQPSATATSRTAARTARSRAQILAVPDGVRFAGPRMVEAISVGLADGVDNGTVFSIWHPGVMIEDDIRNATRSRRTTTAR